MWTSAFVRGVVSVGVVVLFLSISCSPLIESVHARDAGDCRVNVCGMPGVQKTVRLTPEQCREVEYAFERFQERISCGLSHEELVVEVSGLLDVLKSCGVVSRVSSDEISQRVSGLGGCSASRSGQGSGVYENSRCLIVGKGDTVLVAGMASRFLERVFSGHYGPLFEYVFAFLFFRGMLGVVSVAGELGFGVDFGIAAGPCTGWIATAGRNGTFYVRGDYYGVLGTTAYVSMTGAEGFTGIRLLIGFKSYYLGVAQEVKIETMPNDSSCE